MNQHKFVSSFAWIAALLVATPAMGQLANFPVVPLAPGSAYGTTSIGAAFGRGLKNSSLRESVVAARITRGLQTVSFGASAGYIAKGVEKVTLAGSMAVHLLRDSDLPVQVSLQTGLGWMRQDIFALSLTQLESTPPAGTVELRHDHGPQQRAALMKRTTKYVGLACIRQ